MSTWSVLPIAVAGITFYVGLYHFSIYVRRKQHREDLSFALMCLAAGFYCIFCAGLYNVTSVGQAVDWQRAQFISLALFLAAFLWFVGHYTWHKPGLITYGFWAFFLVAIVVQAVDRTSLTWITDAASIKTIPLPFRTTIIYREAALGPFTAIQGLVGLAAGAHILWHAVRYYRRGHRKEARPLLVALGLVYLAGASDTAVSDGVYRFVYVLEYAYLAMIVLMEYSLSGAVVEAASTRDALQKSEERLKLALEAANDGLFDWDMRTGEVYFSPRFYTMLGYDPYELPQSADPWLSLLHPDDKDFITRIFQEYSQGKRSSHEVEARFRTRSGGLKWVLSRGRVMSQPAEGEPGRIFGTHVDITERRQAEAALRQLSQASEMALRLAHMGRWEYDAQAQVFTFNDQYYSLHGTTADKVGGYKMSADDFARRFVFPADAHIVSDGIRVALETTDPDFQQQVEARIVHVDGQVRNALAWYRIERDAQGRPTRLLGVSQDITEQKRAEETLRASEDRLVKAQAIAHVGSWEIDPDTMTVWGSDEAVRIYGVDPQVHNMPFTDVLNYAIPEDRPKLAETIREVIEGRPGYTFDYQIRRPSDGEIRYIYSTGERVSGPAGELVRITGVIQDITERKHVEDALRASEDRLVKAQAIAHVGSWEIDLAARTIWGSEEAMRIYGIDPSRRILPLQSIQEQVLPEYRESMDRAMRDLIAGRRGYDEDFQIKHSGDGEVRDLHSTAECVTNENGRPIRITGVVQDITERKKMEHNLQMFQYSIDRASDAVFWHKSDSGLLYANDQACRSLGYTRDELMQLHLEDYDPAFTREMWDASWARMHESRGGEVHMESTHRRKDGSIFPVEVSSKHLWFGDMELRVAIVRDITERKKMEEDLQMFQFSIDQASDAVFWFKADSGLLYVNEQACRSLGYPREELMQLHLEDFDPVYSRERWDREWAEMNVNRRGGGVHVESVNRRKDGSIFPVDVVSKHLWFSDRELHVAVLRDITERKQAEASLRETNDLLSALIEAAPTPIMVLDLEGRVHKIWNPAAEKMFGWSGEDVMGRRLPTVPEEREGEFKKLREQIQSGKTLNGAEVRRQRRDGTPIEYSIYASPLHDAEGKVSGNVAVLIDTTERNRAAKALLESQAVLQATLESMQDGLLVVTGDGTISHHNSRFCEMWGISADLMTAQSDDVLVNSVMPQLADPEQFKARIRHTYQSSEASEDVLHLKDGRLFERVSYPLIQQGEHTGRVWVFRDITAQRKSEEALRASEFFLRKSQTVGRIGSYEFDGRTGMWISSPMLDELFGIDATFNKDIEGWISLIHPDEQKEMREYLLNHVLAGHNRFEREYRVSRHGSRQELWVYGLGEVEYDDQGHPIRMIGTIQDITERKRALNALEASEARFRALVENSPDFITFVDKDNRVGYVNRVDPQMTADEAIGLNVLGYALPEYRATLENEISQAWRTGMPGQCEIQIYRGDRSTSWMNIRVVPIFEAGRIVNVMEVLTDITQRRQAEEALRDSETRLSVIFNQSADLQSVSTVEPGGVFRIIAVNQRYVEAARQHKFDITEHDLVNKTIEEIVTSVFKFDKAVFEFICRYYQKVLDTGQQVRYEEALDTPAGIFHGEVVLAPVFDATNTCRYILYSSRDISERKKAEEEIHRLNNELELRVIERTYQLEVTNRELESFAYSVSHDLRAPLRSIDGFSLALLDDYSAVLDPAGQEHLQRVRAASQRMGQLIDDLLMLSRITRQEMQREQVDLSKMAHEIVADLSQADPERAVGFSVDTDIVVNGDPNLLRVALSNLLSNAWKFTGKRPEAVIRFYETLKDGERVFAVQDNGAGFDMKYADKLFGAFQRLHQKSMFEGTGIGLATVQRIIHRHGGRIWAEAKVDEGATFYFTVSRT